ncbi:MAG: signal peptidase II [Clostridia bacterium]|nr:signal peptidase II [Clostridia bacterium]
MQLLFYFGLVLFAAAAVAADQLTKYLASVYLMGKTVVLVPGWLQLHYITNDGMALSLFRGGRWFFIVLTAAFLGIVVWAVVSKQFKKKPELWCIAAVTGGAIGNLIDRAATGQVIDMICIPWFSTFNVADLFITFGAGILVLYILIKDKEFLADSPKKNKEKQNDADAG